MNSIRQRNILEYIETNQIVTIKELQNLFPDVSLMTIHRDLDVLSQGGAIVKVRGGARAVRHTGDPGFDVRLEENNPGKMSMDMEPMSQASVMQPSQSTFRSDRSVVTRDW